MGQSSPAGDGAAPTGAADSLDPAERERLQQMGRAIRDLRTAADLSQDDLVARSKADGRRGVSKTTISNMETGKTDSRLSSYRAAAAALGFTGRDALDAMLAAAARHNAPLQDVEANASPKATNPLPNAPGAGGVSSPRNDGNAAGAALNVGRIFEGVRLLPVYRWGTLGDPTSAEDAPKPDRLAPLRPDKGALVGERGFGVEVRGESMRGWRRPIWDGEICWINPAAKARPGGLVCALVDANGESGAVIKELNVAEDGRECLFSHYAPEQGGRRVFACERYCVIGPVVGIERWRSPDE